VFDYFGLSCFHYCWISKIIKW